MLRLLKNKKFQILVFTFACTLLIYNINKKNNMKSDFFPKLPFNLRELLDTDKVEKRCENTKKDFLEKYNKDIKPQDNDGELDKYPEVLKDMIKEKNLKKISKYLPRIIVYLIIAIFGVLLLIIWVFLCGCYCSKKKSSATGCSKCYFFLFFLFTIIAMIVCVYGFILAPSLTKSFNGVICSLYKLVFHFIEGTKDDFPQNKWKGSEGIDLLIEQYDTLISQINALDNNKCAGDYKDVCTDMINNLKSDKNNNEGFIHELENSKKEISLISSAFNKVKNETLDDIEDVMDQYIDKYFKLGVFGLFSILLALCVLGLLFLSMYFICNCSCVSCLYHLIWNIEMLAIIIIILIGSILGAIGVMSKDLIPILYFTKSFKNLNSDDPFLLDFDKTKAEKINICLNGNGNLVDSVFDMKINYQSDIENYSVNFTKIYPSIPANSQNKDQFDKINEIINNMTEFYHNFEVNNFTSIFNCEFFRWDFEILTSELNDCLVKKITLFSMVIIVADLISFISIFFGYIIVTNYKGSSNEEPERDRHIQMNPKRTRQNMDSSSDNLRRQN